MAFYQKHYVIYDGECAFCRKQIERIRRYDKLGQFEYYAKQSDDLLIQFPELEPYESVEGLRFVSHERTVAIAAPAVYEIYRRLSPFNFVAWVYKLPGIQQLCNLAYAWIAKNRYKWSQKCDSGTCSIPE